MPIHHRRVTSSPRRRGVRGPLAALLATLSLVLGVQSVQSLRIEAGAEPGEPSGVPARPTPSRSVPPSRPAPDDPSPAHPSPSEPGPPAPGPAEPGPAEPGDPDRPNLVVVMADDMRQDDLRFAPNVRRLVLERGTQFVNSFSPFPLCCPARASFLTGQYAHNHGVYHHLEPYGFGSFDDSFTLATALRRSGYHTAFVGKYLNNYGRQPSLVTGEPSWRYVPPGWEDWRAAVEAAPGSPATGDTYRYFDTSYNLNGTVWNDPGSYQTDTLGAMARDVVREYAGDDAPFFLYLSFVAPHTSALREDDDPPDLATPERPDRVKGRFDDVVTKAPGLTRRGASDRDMSDEAPIMRGRGEPDADLRAQLVASTRQRAEAISVLDEQLGRLVRTLERRGEWDDTVLLFTSDNGYFLGEHRRPSGKVLPHEPSLRVPLALAGRGVPAGELRYDPVTTVDLTATLAEYAGVTDRLARHHVPDGLSMVPVVRDGDRGWRRPVLTEAMIRPADDVRPHGFGHRDSIGVRVGGWKYVRYLRTGELYDLDDDPNELRNLWDEPGTRDVRQQLGRLWHRLKDCAGVDCTLELPAELQWSAQEARDHTDAQLAGVRRRTGTPQR